jgi:hypothetical protein
LDAKSGVLTPKKEAKKGPEYNSCMLPFIQTGWNIDNARRNTDSLNRMIGRIEHLISGRIQPLLDDMALHPSAIPPA